MDDVKGVIGETYCMEFVGDDFGVGETLLDEFMEKGA